MKNNNRLQTITPWVGYLILLSMLGLISVNILTNKWFNQPPSADNQDNISHQATQHIATRVFSPSKTLIASLTPQPSPTSPIAIATATTRTTSTPMSTVTPTLTQTPLPTIAWDTPPPCDTALRNAADWHQFAITADQDPVTSDQLTVYLRQIQAMSSVLDNLDKNELLKILNVSDSVGGIEVAKRELIVLWLNVVSGQLNRATQINISKLSDIHTVDELLTLLEENLGSGEVSKVMLETNQIVQQKQNISLWVCNSLLHLRTDNEIGKTLWSTKNIDTEVISFASPSSPNDIHWNMYHLKPSPNYRWLAIQTVAYESNGPIYLWERQSGKLINLNELLNSVSIDENKPNFSYGGLDGWEVIGWHPDSQHLLLGLSRPENLFWVDLERNTYQHIKLPINTYASSRYISLAPDGSGFVYIDQENNRNEINFYNLNSEKNNALFTLSDNNKRIYYPSFSPVGDSIAYIVEKGHPTTALTYTLELFNLNTSEQITLFEGNLSNAEPIWSPDGRMIAFTQKSLDVPSVYIPLLGPAKQRNIWVVSVSDGKAQQITFIKGAAYQPVWAPDGYHLAFLTHQGQIGITSLNKPNQIWQATTNLENELWYFSVDFLP